MITLTNLDEIQGFLASRFRAITIQALSRTGRSSRFTFGFPGTSGIAMAAVDFGRASVCRADGHIDFLPLHFPLSGYADVQSGRHGFQSIPGTGISPGGGEAFQMRASDDWRMRVYRLDLGRVMRELRGLLGYEPETALKLHPRIDFRTPGGLRLQSLLLAAAGKGNPHDAQLLETELICSLLLSQRHNYSEILACAKDTATPALVRRAQAYLEDNHHRALSLAQLATALHTSARSLSRGFRRHLGTSPMAYLRESRLQSARMALLRQRDGESVTQIALSCGFTHLGRFAVDYKRRFGESPSRSRRHKWHAAPNPA